MQTGLDNAATGLKLLHGWFQNLDATIQTSNYWDPGDVIRNETVKLLNEIERREGSWQEISRRLNRLGIRMEQEINLSARDIEEAQQP